MSHGERSKEPIYWESEELKAKSTEKPGAKYGALSEALRHTISPETTCSMFCGGKKCKYELAEPWKEDQQAIKGVYSNWITDNILATARPNTTNIEKYDMITQYKDNGITAIINLQLPGEHASCGNGLEEGGFSYKPQQFMDNDIFFYNFGWPDYGVGSLANLLDMVKVMQFALSEGKVAVHCHAGLGRTGVLIAAYLIYANRMTPNEVVHYIRSKRAPSVQTRSQFEFIQEFAQYLTPLRVVFSSHADGAYDFTLPQYLIRQSHILHGFEARRLKHIPKVIDVCCNRLLELAGLAEHSTHTKDTYDIMRQTASFAFNNRSSTYSSLPKDKSDSDLSSKQRPKLSKKLSVSLESFSACGKLYQNGSRSPGMSRSSSEQEDSEVETRPNGTVGYRRHRSSGRTEDVAIAMACAEYTQEVKEKVAEYKKAMNESQEAWTRLEEETDVETLSCLIWEWIDHLKEPILHVQDLPLMLEYSSDPLSGLSQLNKGARQTVEQIFEVVAALEPMSETVEQELIQRAISTLTHQNMVLETDPVISPTRSLVRRTSNDTGLMRDSVANRLMVFFLHLIHVLMEKLAAQSETKSNGDAYDDRLEASSRSRGDPDGKRPTGSRRPASAKGHTRTPPSRTATSGIVRRQHRISEDEEED